MNKMNVMSSIASQIRKHPRLVSLVRKAAKAAHIVSPEMVVVLDYPIHSRQRWDQGNPHQKIYDILNRYRNSYESNLRAFLPLSKYFTIIPERQIADAELSDPCWING